MVSKVTVTALVLVVAIPIMLGYAMNFQDVQRSEWRSSDSRDVTDLINNDLAWMDTASNTYSINARVISTDGTTVTHYPYFSRYAPNPITSIKMDIGEFEVGDSITLDSTSGTISPLNNEQITLTVTTSSATTAVPRTSYAFWESGTLYVFTHRVTTAATIPEVRTFTNVVSVTASAYTEVQYFGQGTTSNMYAQPIYGWTAYESRTVADEDFQAYWTPPAVTENIILTVSLGGMRIGDSRTFQAGNLSIANNPIAANPITFSVIADPDHAGWKLMQINGINVPMEQTESGIIGPTTTIPEAGNVWQIEIDSEGYHLHYVYSWPMTFGRAQSYYNLDIPLLDEGQTALKEFTTVAIPGETKIRADYASQRTTSYPVAVDSTYNPLTILADPTANYRITMPNPDQIGTSITFGGQTFNVTNGAITVGGSKIEIKNLRLDSTFSDGVRTNSINGTEISEGVFDTTFGGTWSTAFSQSKLTFTEWTSKEWVAGGFAWNGVDENFAVAGLLGSLAVFIGLGMYGRRSGAKVGMLMLICGTAALIFLAMI